MANDEHLAKLKEGVEGWNQWRKDNPDVKPDLLELDFTSKEVVGELLWDEEVKRVDLRGANLENADVSRVRFSRSSQRRLFQGIRVATCYGSQIFKTFAQDQDFIEELRYKGGWRGGMLWLWWLFADWGRSIGRWALWSVLFALAFAFVFYHMSESHFHFARIHPSFITTIYYSVVTFTTLGFGDITPKTEIAAMAIMAEVILGCVMLGGLISILANKLARRA